MKLLRNQTEELCDHISGFHQFVLTDPIHLSYVSHHFCEMIGWDRATLLSEDADDFAPLVHPADREIYDRLLAALRQTEQTLTAEYRLLQKDGRVLTVRDTITSQRLEDGTLVGNAVLTDITDLKSENQSLRFLNETIPCGCIKYTCEKQPRVTYINQQMKTILRFPSIGEGGPDLFELYRDNIFLMIPMEQRSRFVAYLQRVYDADAPIAGEMSLLRCDGSKAYVFGWVTKCINAEGEEEFQSICMDVTERHHAKKASEAKRYLEALTEVYDKIFEYDFAANTVQCLYGKDSPRFRWLEHIPMQIEEATKRWITATVVQEDQARVLDFFCRLFQREASSKGEQPPQITYRARSSEGEIKHYRGIFLNLEESVSLYCCRCISDPQEIELLRSENDTLKENMQELAMRFADGIAAFEVSAQGMVKPLYASDNACEFFGFTKEEWLPLMKQSTPLQEFVARSEVAYEDFAALLDRGEAAFSYYDLKTKTKRRIKAICSRKTPGTAPRHVMLYTVDQPPQSSTPSTGSGIFVRTFGYFDVFVEGNPIAFRHKKSKELLALLIDRRGGFVSSDEAIGFLWEEESVSSVTLARYRKVALRLKNTLEEYGISDIIESVDGNRRIITERLQCDLYQYLSEDESYAHLFKGSYLTNYSWGEQTLAQLSGTLME